MQMNRLQYLALAAALGSSAHAGDFSMPSGVNLESAPGAPVVAQLTDGTLLYSTGSFLAEQLSTRNPNGSFTLVADGFGSLAGIAQSPVSGQLVIGDSAGAAALWLLDDLNADGDFLDAGETVPHPVALPLLGGEDFTPFDIAFRPGTDEFWMTGSNASFAGGLARVQDGSAEIVVDSGLGFAAGVVFDGDTLYFADSGVTNRVLRLDVSDANPTPALFADALPGAYGIALADDGALFVAGSSCVSRLAADLDDDGLSDAVDACFLDGFPFSSSLLLVEGPGGFTPGVEGDGTLYVGDFSFAGARTFRTAPLAATSVDGGVMQNSKVTVGVHGAPGALGFFVLSFDTAGTTVAGIGDLCLGFAGLNLISPMRVLDGAGEASFQLLFREYPALVDMPLAIQGITLESGRFGIGNGLDFIFGA